MSGTETAPVAEKAASKAERSVDLIDAAGQPIGVTVRLKPTKEAVERGDGEEAIHHQLRQIAKNVSGMSAMDVDGEEWSFSQERLIALMQRFPHFAKQIEAGIKA